jgi:beta-galactosidase
MVLRIVLLLIFFGGELTAQVPAPQLPPWQNPEVVNINKMPARATSVSYPTEKLALAAQREDSPRRISLNGDWKFGYYQAPKLVPPGVINPEFSDNDWPTIPVPANWELHGYGKPWQRLTHQIWEKKGVTQPNIPEDYNPTGIYRKLLTLPKKWPAAQVTLHVGAASSALSVWVNGQFVGYSEDNALPAEFNITPYLKPRQNQITLQVSQWSDGSYLEDQDHWRMSGITREVYLEFAPTVQIYDFAVRTELDEQYQDAELQIRPEIWQAQPTDTKGWTVEAQLYDSSRQAVLASSISIPVDKILNEHYPVIGNRPFENLMRVSVENPRKWSAEDPYLYTLVLSLKDDKNTLVETRSTRVGFREIDTSDGQFRVNGVPVLLYGVNRHDWDARTAKAVTKEAMRRDAQLMKQLNVNASRSSHYPNPPYWYELCDEYGIYVMDEANIESHGLGSIFSNLPAWHTTFLERGIRMVERDKNYPSIVSWSLGNEAGFGPNHAALSAWIKEFDPTRPIHSEGAQNIYGYNWPKPEPKDRIYTDIISRMYRLTDDMVDLATQPGDTRPVLWSEYAHSQAQSTGDLESYWEAIRKYPRLVGGFVWDWRDQLVAKPDSAGLGRTLWAHGTDFGQTQEDLNPIQKGLISADGQIKSGGWQARYVWQRVKIEADSLAKGVFRVENRHFRTNLNQYSIKWTIEREGEQVSSGSAPPLNVAPGQIGKLRLNLPELNVEAGQRYYLNITFTLLADRVWAPKGYAVAQEQFLLAYEPAAEVPEWAGVEESGEALVLSNGRIQVLVSKSSGLLISVSRSGQEYLGSPLQPNFWRPPTDNDLASGMLKRQEVWKKASEAGAAKLVAINHSDTHIYTWLAWENGSKLALTYSLSTTGKLRVEYRLKPAANLPDIPRVGLQAQVPARLSNLSWLGRGPLESYADKKSGAFTGVYQEGVREGYTYYVRPQESSNKTDVWWFALQPETSGQALRVEAVSSPLSISVWPYTAEQISAAGRIEALTFSDTNTMNIDHAQMGVGGDNTWSLDARPHETYRLPAQPYHYSFYITIEE